MARYCNACNRDVHDEAEHELVRIPVPVGPPIRYHVCLNLVLTAEQAARDLVTGERRVLKRYVPEKTVQNDEGEDVQVPDPQRTRMNNARWTHKETLKAQMDAA